MLGFWYQKGKFTADHLTDEAALLWLEETWPEVLRAALEKRAVILFGDEASLLHSPDDPTTIYLNAYITEN